MGKKKKPNNPQSSADAKSEASTSVPITEASGSQNIEPGSDFQIAVSKKNKKKQKSIEPESSSDKNENQGQVKKQQPPSIDPPLPKQQSPTSHIGEPNIDLQSGSKKNKKKQKPIETGSDKQVAAAPQVEVPHSQIEVKRQPQEPAGNQAELSTSKQQPPIQQSPWGQQQKLAWGPQAAIAVPSVQPTVAASAGQSQPGRVQQSQQLPSAEQQVVPTGKKNRNKYPKGGGQATQQQEITQPPVSSVEIPSKSAKDQQVPLAQQMQQKLVLSSSHTPSPASSSAASSPSRSLQTYSPSSRKSKGGFPPLEVPPGSCVGNRGEKIKIEANYLRIQLDRLVSKAYHYDIRFDPEKIPKKHLQDVVEKFRTKYFPKHFVAYDGQNNVYSATPLPINGNTLKDEMLWHDSQTNRDRTIIITIKAVDSCEIDLSAIKKYVEKSAGIVKPQRAIQCLEIVLRMPFSRMFVNVNRSFFTRPDRRIDLGENYELWTGLYQSVVLGDVPLFNIDVVNKPFPSDRTVLEILTNVMNVKPEQPLYQQQLYQLHDYLKGLTLVYNQPGTSFANVYKYNGLKDSASKQTFMLENQKMTVQEYFTKKNIRLRFPHLPCLYCGPTIKNIYLPLEFCSVQNGQVIKKKLSENQIRTVIAETATSTDVRKRRIMDLLQKIRHNDSKVVQQFGVNLGDKFTEVEARILPPPGLEYLNGKEVSVDRGVWNAEREKFLDGKKCTNWSVLKLDDRCPNSDIFKLADMISDIGQRANMSFASKFTDLIEMRTMSRRHEIEEKMQALKKKNVELLFVIIPNRNEAYPNVKQAAELKCGILTQCIKSFTLSKKLNGSTVYNILLKLNSKLNGLNHKVVQRSTPPIGRGKIMIVGADVTHPTGTMNEPSAVGVASSHDINALKYNMCWRIQNPTQEMITDLKNIMVEQLIYYKKCMNNDLPEKILYYRDGVSDGQFDDVLSIELAAIYTACQQMAPKYKPDVTFIVVQKRHNTRFYPGPSKKSCGKNNNVMPGTIVDKFIIDPRQYQFFLVSHAAIQGVAKPTKYCVIWDDSKIKADELQALTYNLCHVFTRCNRAVSYVAPTYYAHLAAYRGKVYIQNERINMDNLEQEFRQRQIREEISKGHPMFFV